MNVHLPVSPSSDSPIYLHIYLFRCMLCGNGGFSAPLLRDQCCLRANAATGREASVALKHLFDDNGGNTAAAGSGQFIGTLVNERL
jgi:hypothetical protein